MKKFMAIIMVLALVVCLFPMAAFADGYSNIAEILPVMARQSRSMSGYISGDNVNFRKAPSTSSDSWGYFQNGESITITVLYYAYADGYWWTQVEARGHTGYVASSYVHYY